MAGALTGTLTVALAVALAVAALLLPGAAASADTGCVVYPRGSAATAVYELASTGSPVVGEVTHSAPGRGPCNQVPGSPYDVCEADEGWTGVRVGTVRGYVPTGCVEIIS